MSDPIKCQWLCREIYSARCTWFLYDRTTMDCKLFGGSPSNFAKVCKEFGFPRYPSHVNCSNVFEKSSDSSCLVSKYSTHEYQTWQTIVLHILIFSAICCNFYFQNIREDYCRFEFGLLENLVDIQTLSDCQTACIYVSHCTFFIFDKEYQVCKLHSGNFEDRICDLVHGPSIPNYKYCQDNDKILWLKSVRIRKYKLCRSGV